TTSSVLAVTGERPARPSRAVQERSVEVRNTTRRFISEPPGSPGWNRYRDPTIPPSLSARTPLDMTTNSTRRAASLTTPRRSALSRRLEVERSFEWPAEMACVLRCDVAGVAVGDHRTHHRGAHVFGAEPRDRVDELVPTLTGHVALGSERELRLPRSGVR